MTEKDKLYADKLKERALSDYKRLDLAINEIERQTCDTPRNNLAESSQDCISREEAINCLTALCKSNRISVGETIALEKVIKELEQTRWIPCSERLPKKKGRYMCTVGASFKNPREMYYAPQKWENNCDDATWRSVDGFYVFDWFVIAWMPLPQPYKESEE